MGNPDRTAGRRKARKHLARCQLRESIRITPIVATTHTHSPSGGWTRCTSASMFGSCTGEEGRKIANTLVAPFFLHSYFGFLVGKAFHSVRQSARCITSEIRNGSRRCRKMASSAYGNQWGRAGLANGRQGEGCKMSCPRPLHGAAGSDEQLLMREAFRLMLMGRKHKTESFVFRFRFEKSMFKEGPVGFILMSN